MLRVDRGREFGAPCYVRWAARIVAWWLIRDKAKSYQCSGKINWLQLGQEWADIQVPTEQLVHWILRVCGHEVCINDIRRHYGRLGGGGA